jgi:hypothetical protein
MVLYSAKQATVYYSLNPISSHRQQGMVLQFWGWDCDKKLRRLWVPRNAILPGDYIKATSWKVIDASVV